MKKTNKYSPEVKERAVRLVQEHRSEYPSLWPTVESIAPNDIEILYNRKWQHSKLGYKSPMPLLNDWLITQQKEKLIA